MNNKIFTPNQKFIIKIYLFFAFFLLISCNSNKIISSKILSTTECPIDGICTMKILKNKSLIIKNDSLNGNSYQIIESQNTTVYHYNYEKQDGKKYQDGSYREEIIFEIPSDVKSLNLKNENLQTTKILFGRFCYCKGFTGFYKIESGELDLKTKNKIQTFVLDFKVLKVPQVLKKISFNSEL